MFGFREPLPAGPKVPGTTERAAAVAVEFGLLGDRAGSRTPAVDAILPELGPRRLVLVTGPSGSGKSSLLAELQRRLHGSVVVDRMAFPGDRAVVDCVAPAGALADSAALLTACGLGEPRLWVRPLDAISDGEKFRAKLAKAISLHAQEGSHGPLLCDEFCSGLHRRLAKAIAFNLRKLVTRRRLAVIVATSRDDGLLDLRPDAVVRLDRTGLYAVERRMSGRKRSFSLLRRLQIVPGTKRDYDAFATMHYRTTDELGFVDRVFVLRECAMGEPVGIVVYAHAPLELSLRNQATNGWFSRNPRRVNESLRILRRLVIHPDLRGCGLGHELVRRTLPRVGVEFIECLAAMGECNPVFEKAGMRRVGQYPVSKERSEALLALQSLGADPNAREFVIQVCRSPQVRAIVHRVVARWYAGTTGVGERRALRQPPELLAQTFRGLVGARPVYYLWRCANSRSHKGGGERMANGESRMANGTAASGDLDRHGLDQASRTLCGDDSGRTKSRTNPFSPPQGDACAREPKRTRGARKDCRPDRKLGVDYGATD